MKLGMKKPGAGTLETAAEARTQIKVTMKGRASDPPDGGWRRWRRDKTCRGHEEDVQDSYCSTFLIGLFLLLLLHGGAKFFIFTLKTLVARTSGLQRLNNGILIRLMT